VGVTIDPTFSIYIRRALVEEKTKQNTTSYIKKMKKVKPVSLFHAV